MGFFSRDTEADALKQIDKINREMREISALIHLNYNLIDGRNRSKIRLHYNIIEGHVQKYERIKRNLSEMDQIMFLGATVDVWNGERVGVLIWEEYLRNTLRKLNNDLNY